MNWSLIIAGMPSPLPEDISTIFQLNRDSEARLQAISFFFLGLLVSNTLIWALWNYVAKDSSWLPKLSFGKATCLVVLWGALFVIVLTMISGARELLTPGAWKKNGITYTLSPEPNSAISQPSHDGEVGK